MNTLKYDLIVLAVTIVSCFIYNFFLSRHPAFASKKYFTFFLVFLAMYPLLNMVAHLIAVGTFSFIRWQHGVFKYDIKFYTLIQFGVLLILINGYLLSCIKQISRGNWRSYRQVVLSCVLQSAIILPMFPFNPICLLPVATSVLLILQLMYARWSRNICRMHLQQEERSSATYA